MNKKKERELVHIPLNITIEIPMQTPKKKSKLRYYLFCIRWLWKNREWENTRQKFKAMEKAYRAQCEKKLERNDGERF